MRYGLLTVVSETEPYISPGGQKERSIRCVSDCGNNVIVRLGYLRRGHTRSCGCYKIEIQTIHGLCKHPLYRVWLCIKRRCYGKNNENYRYYGGRGISVCDEWINNPESFIKWGLNNGYKVGLTLDRRDNDGDYEPANCRFVTQRGNLLNSRLLRSNNTSGYRGVFYHKMRGEYMAYISINGTRIHLGYYLNKTDAAKAYDREAIKHGYKTNFKYEEEIERATAN